jgi:hypothetical protein
LALAVACATGTDDGRDAFSAGDASTDGLGSEGGSTPLPPGDGAATGDGASSSGSSTTPCGGKVVINEVMPQDGNPLAEFIELYNSGTCAVSIQGWVLAYRAGSGNTAPFIHTFAAGDEVPAKGYLVAGRDEYSGNKDVVITGTTSVSSDDGHIALVDGTGSIVDGIAYGSAKAAADGGTYVEGRPAPSPSDGDSIARKVDGVDTDDNESDFRATTATPGAPN